jgi:cyclophilin family peptidyl-prolyl cis-trans isomerase
VPVIFLLALFASCLPDYEFQGLGEGLFAEFKTNKGIVLTELYFKEKPLTVSNFVSLSEGVNTEVIDSLKGVPYYNGTLFHRVLSNFMIQGGDPSATGLGHPGYKFADEFIFEEEDIVKFKHDGPGILSMANSGPDTNGSQFFITHKATPWLDGKHSVFGKVRFGQEVVDSITQMDTLYSIRIIRQGDLAEDFDSAETFKKSLNAVLEKKEKEEETRLKAIQEFLSQMNYDEAILNDQGVKIFEKWIGDGEIIKSDRHVRIHYIGYFENGDVFGSSYSKNKPLEFTMDVDHMITGLTEGIRGRSEGSELVLFIPHYLAYGEEGRLPKIPPRTNLIFDITILEPN